MVGIFFRAVFFSGVPIKPVTALGVSVNDFLAPTSFWTSFVTPWGAVDKMED